MPDIRFELHRPVADRVAEQAAEKVANAAGVAVQTRATDLVHVVTGRLRTSIGYETVKPGIGGAHVTAYVGSEVDYALFEEVLHPYLRPALDALRGLDYPGGDLDDGGGLVTYTRRDGSTRTATSAQARNWSSGAQG